MSMTAPLSPAQLRVLRLLSQSAATRQWHSKQDSGWAWVLDGKPESGVVDRLIRRKLAQVVDHDRVEISEFGRRLLGAA